MLMGPQNEFSIRFMTPTQSGTEISFEMEQET